MKTLIVSPHSFVDLITNSSSELFICDTKKSIDTVKEIIIELVNITNKKMRLKGCKEYDISSVFINMFQEPKIFQFNFPHTDERSEYLELDEFGSQRNNHVYRECLIKSNDWERKNPAPKFPHYVYPNYPTEEEQIPYKEENKIYIPKREAAMDIIWKPFHILYKKAHCKCLMKYCELNNINFNEIDIDDTLSSQYAHIYVKEGKHTNFINEFESAMSYNYIIEKGNIIIQSYNDNSVPYELFEDLEDILHAQRVHLG